MHLLLIEIDKDQSTGCGLCIPNRPEDAIAVVERDAEPYEQKVMTSIAGQGTNTIRAHLEHLKSHGETALPGEATGWLADNGGLGAGLPWA